MAYVAITHKLESAIMKKIRGLENIEIAGEKKPEVPALTGMEDWLRPILWGVLTDTPFEGDPSLSVADTSIDFKLFYTNSVGIETSVFETLPCLRVSRFYDVNEYGQKPYNFRIHVYEDTFPYFKELADHLRTTREISVRWDKVAKQVSEFLGSCKSLNEALKLWPDLRRYVPEEALARINEKTEKPKKDQSAAMAALAKMDLESISVSNVLARMAGAEANQGDTTS